MNLEKYHKRVKQIPKEVRQKVKADMDAMPLVNTWNIDTTPDGDTIVWKRDADKIINIIINDDLSITKSVIGIKDNSLDQFEHID